MILQISCLVLPGADFFVTISNSIKYGYRHGISTAVGIGLGLFINGFVTYWFGSFLQYQQPILFKILICIGASYLLYIAYILFKNVFSKQDAATDIKIKTNNIVPKTILQVFINGTFTNLANVKVVIFFSSMLSLVDSLSTTMVVVTWASVTLATIIWFSIVALLFGNERLRVKFLRNINKIEFISGSFILCFAIVVIYEVFV